MEKGKANWLLLPSEILNHLFSFLPVSDVVNAAKIGVNWNACAIGVLRKVKIDGSTPFGGSWLEWNKDTQSEVVRKQLSLFVNSLCEVTNRIEHLHLDTNMIDSQSIEKLLMHQCGIKTLLVNYRKDTCTTHLYYSACVGRAVLNGIIRHEPTLQKLNIGIEDYFIPFKQLTTEFSQKQVIFPNLKSVEFLSTTAGSCGYMDYVSQRSLFNRTEWKKASEFLEKLLRNPKIEELNFEPFQELRLLFHEWEVFWHPDFNVILGEFFKKGCFSGLKKINIDSLSKKELGCCEQKFTKDVAKLIIDNCPHISHIDSDVSYDEVFLDSPANDDDTPMCEMLTKYGNQLVFLNCPFMTTDIGKCVIKNCPNIETLTIVDSSNAGLDDEVFLSLGKLEKLKKLKLIFDDTQINIVEFFENTLGRLEELFLGYRSCAELKISVLDVIKECGAGLRKLFLQFYFDYTDEEYQKILNGVLGILECCHNLSSFGIQIRQKESLFSLDNKSRRDVTAETRNSFSKAVSEMLISKQKGLRYLYTCPYVHIDLEDRRKIVDGLPQCKFDTSFMTPKFI